MLYEYRMPVLFINKYSYTDINSYNASAYMASASLD